jgi:hypothetical protein
MANTPHAALRQYEPTSEPSLDRTINNIDKALSAIMHFMVDQPKGTEVADACRETAYCWATLARVKQHGGLNEFSENVIDEVITRLERATNLLEKIHAKN